MALLLEVTDQVGGGGLAGHRGAGGDQNLTHPVATDSFQQRPDLQLPGADPVHGGEYPVEDMVFTLERRCFFDGHQIGGFLDYADQAVVPTGVAADLTRIVLGESKADRAEGDQLMQLA